MYIIILFHDSLRESSSSKHFHNRAVKKEWCITDYSIFSYINKDNTS